MKEKLSILLVTIVLFATAIVLSGQRPVMAADKNGCEVIGTVGSIIVASCYDPNSGLTVIANSAGMLAMEP